MATGSIRRSSLLVLLAGCAAPDPPGEVPPRVPEVVLRPDPQGFAVEGSALRIDWGRAEAGAVAALSKGFGPPVSATSCGDLTAYGFAGGVTAYFRRGALRGWRSASGSAGAGC